MTPLAYTTGTTKLCPLYGSVHFTEITLVEFDRKTTKSGQNLCSFYEEYPLYGVSVLERFHCCEVGNKRRAPQLAIDKIIWSRQVSSKNVYK